MRTTVVALAASLALSACGNGASSPPGAIPISIANNAKLQLGVGTARINTAAGSFVGTNFTMTFRGADGNNATGVNTPTISGPPTFKIGFAGSPNSVHGLSPLAFSTDVNTFHTSGVSTDFIESLGPYVGVFGYGLASDNAVSTQLTQAIHADYTAGTACSDLVSNGDPTVPPGNVESGVIANGAGFSNGIGTGAVSSELGLPLGSGNQNSMQPNCPFAAAGQASQPLLQNNVPINYYGGPPAWPSPQGYGTPASFLGFSLGFTDSPAAPVVGQYSLDVAYATSADYAQSAHVTATASLKSLTILPAMPEPSLRVNPDGSGVVTIDVPPGLAETIVEVRTADCRPPNVGSNPDNNYSAVLHSSGPQSVVFASHLGPPDSTGAPSSTFCAVGIVALVSAIGFDYPAYESSYPFDTSVLPKITNGDGHTGQADVTTSPTLLYPPVAVGGSVRRARPNHHAP